MKQVLTALTVNVVHFRAAKPLAVTRTN